MTDLLPADDLVRYAVGLHKAGRHEAAEAIFRQVLARDPGRGDAAHLLGMVLAQTGRLKEAEAHIRQALARFDAMADLHASLGLVLADLHRLDEAVACWRRALALAPADTAWAEEIRGRLAAATKALPMPPPKGDAAALLALARQRLRADDLGGAERLCREALAEDDSYADAWNMLGVLALQTRDEAAIDHFAAAVRHAPQVAAHRANHATALYQLGRLADAAEVVNNALVVIGARASLLAHLGDIRFAQGDSFAAAAAYRLALEHLDREQDQGMAPEVERPRVQGNLARALCACGLARDAAAVARDRASSAPGIDAWRDLAITLLAAHDADAAIEPILRAVTAAPERADLRVTAAAAFIDANRIDEAVAHVATALDLDPGSAEAYANRGFIALRRGDAVAAAADFRAALDRHPPTRDANIAVLHQGLGMSLLQQGNIAAGAPHFAWRRHMPGLGSALPGLPEWDGTVMPGAHLVITATRGHGDVLHFIRYAPLLRAAGMRVVFRGMDTLLDLIAASNLVEEVGPLGQPLPPPWPGGQWVQADCMALLSLAGTPLGWAGHTVPYLTPPPDAVARWHGVLDILPPVRVALSWAGSTLFPYHRHRSPRLAPLLPLLTDPRLAGRVGWVSVQTDDGRRDLDTVDLPLAAREDFLDMADGLRSFADTAAVLAQVDLVISMDTAVAHLAGGLGRPLWLMLDTGAEWRWLTARADSPWYPTATLFRQARPGDWPGVVATLADALAAHVGSVPTPAALGSGHSG
ncbi:tetratricopeptide repeat protein [Nitrospirillum pindoramense]|uniref:Tetratricopeptide (TPR) repeat protein n=1 Tax=Nitrospirillum amazonense TaxID=28077 RepID=A0A560H8J4_9PROT|nr:tetratricopeptide repeat protein [Nitrospirillum amazonense]TWB42643.1 tetratricopeptide (TPR) repeat protein [Nitrospirillum amazonense]